MPSALLLQQPEVQGRGGWKAVMGGHGGASVWGKGAEGCMQSPCKLSAACTPSDGIAPAAHTDPAPLLPDGDPEAP